MIKTTDRIFKIYSTKEEFLGVDYSCLSYFGWEGADSFAFEVISDSYKKAALLIFQEIQDKKGHNDVIDGLVYPLFFCYRHSVELYLKAIYFKHSRANESSKKSFLEKGHNLGKLWGQVRPILEDVRGRFERFSANIDALDSYIKQINEFDSSSMMMRYPTNKDLSPNKEEIRLDVYNLNTCLFNFLYVLNKIDCEMKEIFRGVKSFDKTDREQFLNKILKNKSFIDHIIEVSNHGSGNPEKFEIIPFSKMDSKRLDPTVKNSLLASTSEQLMLINVLFYAGEESKTINWPKDTHLKKEQFLDICCFFMDYFHFSFDIKDLDKDTINILSKTDSVIHNNLSVAMSFFPES